MPSLSSIDVSSYLVAIKQYPILSSDEEFRLGIRVFDESDTKSADTLILSHLRFSASIARRYEFLGIPLPDLIQEANIGLIILSSLRQLSPLFSLNPRIAHSPAEGHQSMLENAL